MHKPVFWTLSEFLQLSEGATSALTIYSTVVRYLFPILAFWILMRCLRSMLQFRKEPEIWAWLNISGTLLPVTHWENLIGRSNSNDIVIRSSQLAKHQAVLTRYDDGSWSLQDIGGRGGIKINGEGVSFMPFKFGDEIELEGIPMKLEPVTEADRKGGVLNRTRAGRSIHPVPTLLLLTLFQLMAALQLLIVSDTDDLLPICVGFGCLILLQWAMYFALKALRRSAFELETIAFFLSTLGIAVISSSAPGSIYKQLICIVVGIILYFAVGWSLRDLERAKKIRYVAAIAGVLLLLVTIVLGTALNGAKNWIYIGSFSFQPSELAKICFIFVGASTMDRIVTKHNLITFLIYSGIVCGLLAIMSDFGTAVIFFSAFLVIAFLRSGSFAAIALILTGTGFAGSLVLSVKPYIKRRFGVWGNVWADAYDLGYQQTQSMMCIAAGGLFGLGAGTGWLRYVAAGDTDLVFGMVAEEWGLLMALMMVISLAGITLFVIRSASVARSSFYTIGACAAATIFVVQAILNVFGTVDFLPLTGVTFPFVSNGGSSMMASWGLLAFIKAADTRQNASFAVVLSREGENAHE